MSGDTKLSCPERNSEDAIKWAAENGLDVIIPNNNQLLLDIDNNQDRAIYTQNWAEIGSIYGVTEVEEWPSRSNKPGRTHMRVTLRTPITPLERVLIQAVLGSDRRRELHSLRRIMNSEETPTLFFEKRK